MNNFSKSPLSTYNKIPSFTKDNTPKTHNNLNHHRINTSKTPRTIESPKSTLSQLPEKQRKQIEFIDEIYNKVVNKPSNKHNNRGHEKTKTTLVNEDKENKVPPIIFYSDEEYSDHKPTKKA